MRHLPTTRHTCAGACRAMALVAAALLTVPVGVHTQAPATLDIYWIDVEGGAATLVVTPERDAVLMDTGWPRADARDAGRIQTAMRDAGITEIDYLLISHFHRDHVAGSPHSPNGCRSVRSSTTATAWKATANKVA